MAAVIDENSGNTIVSRYRNGDTMKQIAKSMNIPVVRVSKHIHECGEFTEDFISARTSGKDGWPDEHLANLRKAVIRHGLNLSQDAEDRLVQNLKALTRYGRAPTVRSPIEMGQVLELFSLFGSLSMTQAMVSLMDYGIEWRIVKDLAERLNELTKR